MTLQLHELLLKANLLAVLCQPVFVEENSGKDLGGQELKSISEMKCYYLGALQQLIYSG